MKSKQLLFIIILILFSSSLYSQKTEDNKKPDKRSSITIGFMQGGGSLAGADFEFLLTKNFGIQVGAGFVGFGAGLNVSQSSFGINCN